MIKTTVHNWEIERIARLQELVRLLELKTFSFLNRGLIQNPGLSGRSFGINLEI